MEVGGGGRGGLACLALGADTTRHSAESRQSDLQATMDSSSNQQRRCTIATYLQVVHQTPEPPAGTGVLLSNGGLQR